MEESEPPKDFVSRSILGRKSIRFWDKFLSWLFSYSARSYKMGKRIYLSKIPFSEYGEFFRKYARFGTVRGIVCTVSTYEEDLRLVEEMLKNIHAHYDDEVMREIISADFWGKAVSYRMLKKPQTLQFSSASSKNPILFHLDTTIPMWHEIQAFGFTSSQGEALLLFRGTDISLLSQAGRASMLSDIDPEGPGYALFQTAKKEIEEWLQLQKQRGLEIRVIGHSLGGALACYSLLTFPHLFSKTHTSYATNYPGVNKDLFTKWANLSSKPRFLGIVTEGDAVSKCGFLLEGTALFKAERKLPPLQSHELLFGAEPLFSIYEINMLDENTTKSRRFISKFHRGASTILYQIGLKHILPSEKKEQ